MHPFSVAVPGGHSDAFKSFVEMPAPVRRGLIGALAKPSSALGLRDLIQRAKGFTEGDTEVAESLVRMLVSLCSVRLKEPRMTSAELVEALVLVASDKFALADQEGGVEALKGDLTNLLADGNPFLVSTKALDVVSEQERSLCRARIITDVRPVFSDDAGKPPQAFVAVHALRMSYHSSDELHEFFVTMTVEDLSELRILIDRAITKDATLKALMQQKDLPWLEPETH